MQDYPIFLTGNPPDLVRLAIEFGHVPFVDHLLHRGFRPRDLPEYFPLIPFLTTPAQPFEDHRPSREDASSLAAAAVSSSSGATRIGTQRWSTDTGGGVGSSSDHATATLDVTDEDEVGERRRTSNSGSSSSGEQQAEHRDRNTALLKRSLELNQIWECMRLASQELMDACSRADLDAVLKVLDSTLIHPRLSLEETAAQEAAAAAAAVAAAAARNDVDDDSGDHSTEAAGRGIDKHGKQRQSSIDPIQIRHDSIGTGSEARFLEEDLAFTEMEMSSSSFAGAGTSSSHQAPAVNVPSRDHILDSTDGVPTVIHRASLFRPRSRVNSDGDTTTTGSHAGDNSSHDDHHQPNSPVVRSNSDTLSGSDNTTDTNTNDIDHDPPPHMPWIDGRALTSALLAVCFRRNGYDTLEAELEEELRAVPIVKELLRYDCMLTAQSMGQAVLGVAYSRSTGSLKRVREQRLIWRKHRVQSGGGRRQDRSIGGSSVQSRRDSVSQQGGGVGSSFIGESSSAGAVGAGTATGAGQQVGGLTETVMDLLLERIGPREWLKLIKCYLQRQEFDDLVVVLERCPFKGPQLETRNKEQQDKNQQQRSYTGSSSASNARQSGFAFGAGGGISGHQGGGYDRQRAREMICRETGICGVGTRIGHFNDRGIGQSSYNVASTLYEASRILFTGSGTRFSHSYMLPRGGFRGIGGNSSGHTGSPNNSNVSQVAVETADESVHMVDEEGHLGGGGGSGVGGSEMDSQQTPLTSDGPPQQQVPSQSNSRDRHQQSSQLQSDPARRTSRQHGNVEQDSDAGSDDDSSDSDGPAEDGEDDPESNNEHLESHDSNFAFGGVGSSTTSSSRPGPGIVGIAIQVQAPEHILNALLKMGFRFFSICDLSISDNRHPLALQFRQQEKTNRQLIEFCMVPNLERLGDGIVDVGGGGSGGRGKKGGKGKRRKFEKRDESRYGEADREAHAQAVQLFLYPAANNPTRGWSSIPALPSMISSISQRISTSLGGGGGHYYSNPPSPSTPTHVALPSVSAPSSPSPAAVVTSATTAATHGLTPSNRLQFILPPMQLGDSFEAISTVVRFSDQHPDHAQSSSSPTTSTANNYNSDIDAQSRYRQSGFGASMPLPIRTSMVEKRLSTESSFFALQSLRDSTGNYLLPRSPSTSSSSFTSPAIHFSTQQRMLHETVRRRIRETLRSDYMDLMTVGICLYQACYHAKEVLLTVLLEHRLLIAQDALTGAVQVAASVGWKRGLELLLVQCGDMEAEIEPVVTTTSDMIHLGASMKWDHATAVQVFPSGRRAGEAGSSTGRKAGLPGSLGSRRGARIAAAGGLEGLVTRGLRRHRSDGSRLNRFGDGSGSGGFFNGGGGVSYVSGDGSNSEQRPLNRRASFEFSHSPVSQPGGVFSTSPTAESPPLSNSYPLNNPLLEPVIPSPRSSSLRSRLSSLIPNLGVSSGSTTDLLQRPSSSSKCKQQQSSSQQQQQSTRQGSPSALLPTAKTSRTDSPPAILMLSTSGLWSLPSVMMQRKSRNAVVALMAACTRNDPGLVTWLIETFADIKVVHIMQALMIACDRGYVRVIKALLGDPLVVRDAAEGSEGVRAGKKKASSDGKKKDDSSRPAAATSRSLFRRWLAIQYQQIMDLSSQPTSSSSSANRPAGSGVTEHENECTRSDPEGGSAPPSIMPRYNSFPFVFLMESSPLFRHYYQTLNTLSSCEFMLKRTASDNPGAGAGGPGVSGARGTYWAPSQGPTTTPVAGSSPNPTGTPQQQQQQTPPADQEGEPSIAATANNNTTSAGPTPTSRARPTTTRQTPPTPSQDLKKEIIRLMLSPILETCGAISVRKAMDRLPKDCWWPLDHDVRMFVDQMARKDMVAVVVGMKRRQKREQQQQEKDTEGLRVQRVMRERVVVRAQEVEHDEREGQHGHRRQGSRMVDLGQMSAQKKKEQQKRGGGGGGGGGGGSGARELLSDEEKGEEGGKKKLTANDRWHKASGPFRRVRKWVVDRKKNKSSGKERGSAEVEDGEEKEEEVEGGGSGRSGSVQSTEKLSPFERPGLTIVH
ncbi:hypothetical protein BGX24_009956 [Mortierella sp. AD032]|nr:hypothetical protein BGX24_009956 [Mortierella sp. AD032]